MVARRFTYIGGVFTFILIVAMGAGLYAEEDILFYASFDKSVNADESAGNGKGIFNGDPAKLKFEKALESQKDPLLKLVPSLKGNGLLTGVNGQVVYYQAAGNINPASWTVTFWVKGIDGKNYLEEKKNYQQLFDMCGGGWTRFYKYDNTGGAVAPCHQERTRQ